MNVPGLKYLPKRHTILVMWTRKFFAFVFGILLLWTYGTVLVKCYLDESDNNLYSIYIRAFLPLFMTPESKFARLDPSEEMLTVQN